MSYIEKTDAATATGRGIGIVDDEACADQILGKVDDSIFKEWQRHRVDKHFMPVALQHKVIFGRVIKANVILEPGTAATIDSDPQGLDLTGIFGNLGQAGKGPGR